MGTVKQKTIFREDYKQLISMLIQARKDEGLNQIDLATKLGWRQSDVSKIEQRIRRLDILEFIDICQALGLDYTALVEKALLHQQSSG